MPRLSVAAILGLRWADVLFDQKAAFERCRELDSRTDWEREDFAHGGAIASTGAVAVGGMLYVGSGYAISNGTSGGNVLLAFGVE